MRPFRYTTGSAVIYDSGLNGALEAGKFYGMELKVVKNNYNLVWMY